MAAIGLYMMGWLRLSPRQVYAIAAGQADRQRPVQGRGGHVPGRDPGRRRGRDARRARRGRHPRRGRQRLEDRAPGHQSFFQSLANGERHLRPAARRCSPTRSTSSRPTRDRDLARAIAKVPGDAMMLLGTNTPATAQLVGTSFRSSTRRSPRARSRTTRPSPSSPGSTRPTARRSSTTRLLGQGPAGARNHLPDRQHPREVHTARTLLSTAMSVKRLYFGIPTGAADFWIDEEAWAAVPRRRGRTMRAQGCPAG
jgi:hypothetical protein